MIAEDLLKEETTVDVLLIRIDGKGTGSVSLAAHWEAAVHSERIVGIT